MPRRRVRSIRRSFGAAARRAGSGGVTIVGAQSIGCSAKRTFDVTLSGAGLLASSPLWALIAALIKLEDGGPVFYGQQRSGLNGVPFEVRKFRSMIPDAEAQRRRGSGDRARSARDARRTPAACDGDGRTAAAVEHLSRRHELHGSAGAATGRDRDRRIGAVVERLEDVPGFDERSSVRPGLTGIAQIYAPRDIARRWKFRYDLLYVRRQSFWLDVRLILLSFWITFRGTWEARGSKF